MGVVDCDELPTSRNGSLTAEMRVFIAFFKTMLRSALGVLYR